MMLLMLLKMDVAAGHGYLIEPPSRQSQAAADLSNGETCPQCVVVDDTQVEAEEGRWWTGYNPFAEPMSAPSVTATVAGKTFGVCGVRESNDYNLPGWGPSTNVEQGQILDVSWCINADHGGVFNFRLCPTQELTDLLLTPGITPTSDQQLALETCYQANLLRCDDVPENNCTVGSACQPGWGCDIEGPYFHCIEDPESDIPRCAPPASGPSPCYGGHGLVTRKINIPSDFPIGPNVLSWRWDALETTEVFSACADINVYAPGDAPPPPPVEEPPPPVVEEPSGFVCCFYPNQPLDAGTSCSWCTSFTSPQDEDPFCALSESNCSGVCGGQWCSIG